MLAMAAFLLLPACSGESHQSTSQVVAIVSGEELTAPMLETELTRLPEGADRRDPGVQRATVDRMITQTLFAKRAEELGLAQTPAVAREIESARKTILAGAYLKSIAGERKPSDAEISAFFEAHPELFAQRRQYVLTDVPLRSTAAEIGKYVAAFKQGQQDRESFLALLRKDGVSATAGMMTVSADQVPETLARRLASMTAGDRITYRMGDVQHFAWIEEIRPSPVPLALARSSIASFLSQKRMAEIAESNGKTMRAKAKVEYGDVGKMILAKAMPAATPPVRPGAAMENRKDQIMRGAAGL
ncbi:EpsD family peptidyl-prolyl cis-trans isomerase [Sphingomonas oleivorans]|nr:EpsD family peptidyl-prolyl cis-trans isomerase [Sphingomonas oleivorans]